MVSKAVMFVDTFRHGVNSSFTCLECYELANVMN